MPNHTVGIVGGGILGLAVGRELVRRRPGTEVVLLEKEPRLATHQTGHNSGVVHAGIYYRPGSLKAELCHRGRALLRDYCAEHHLPYDECGKVVVAVDESELGRLDDLEVTATANRVPGLRRVGPDELREVEPHAVGLTALHSPHTAVTDYVRIAHALAAEIGAAGGRVLTGQRVDGLDVGATRVRIHAGDASYDVDRVVLCAGLQSDRVAALAGHGAGPRIVPFRGEYLRVRPERQETVRGLVYPVPDPRYPFLGVHFTRRITGELEIGPNAVLGLRREGYRRRDVSARDVAATLGWPGFWRLARQHWRTGVEELQGSLSVARYLRAAQRYVPSLGPADVVRAGAGVRAQAVDRDGSLVDDFRIDGGVGELVTSVRNAPSPAATSSLAIAAHVVDAMGW